LSGGGKKSLIKTEELIAFEMSLGVLE
jgi:hypothetical protein